MSADPPPVDDPARDAIVLGPLYQGLVARYASNFTAQWQMLGLGLAAQGFVIGAASQVQPGRLFTAALLALVILTIGFIATVSTLRCHLFAQVDRHKLDEYEQRLLIGDHRKLRQGHGLGLKARSGELQELQNPVRPLRPYADRWIFASVGPTRLWVVAELVISVVGAAIPVMGVLSV